MGKKTVKKRMSAFKRRLMEGVGRTFTYRSIVRSGTSHDEISASGTESSSPNRPLIQASRASAEERARKNHARAFDDFGKPSSSQQGSSMMAFATSAATVISSSYSDEQSENAKQQHLSSLYRPTSRVQESQVVHPVICKRDIFIGEQLPEKRAIKDDKPKTTTASDQSEDIAVRRIMEDLSNHDAQSKAQVPSSYSITGSMFCRNMEKGKVRPGGTSAPQDILSPQKPLGLPPNSIMASMLFRSVQNEGGADVANDDEKNNEKKKDASRLGVPKAKTGSSDEDDYEKEKGRKLCVPKAVIRSDESDVSSVTMYSTSKHNEGLAKASSKLLAFVHENMIPELEEGHKNGLYEA